jgi:hypothetical protein
MKSTTIIDTGTNQQSIHKILKVLFLCGIVSSVLYVAMNIFGAMRFEGYSLISHTVSELSAIDAPSRPFWISLGIPYDLLIIAFGAGVWRSAEGKRSLRIVGGLLIAYGAIGLPWMIFAPMHLRGGGFSLTDTMHIVLAMVTVVMMLAAIGFGAAAFGKRFRYYSIVTIVLLLVFGALTSIDGPRVAANEPTPFVGLWERINIMLFLAWIVVLAIILLRLKSDREKNDETIPDRF